MMKNHACMAIGINQYQFLEPLSYAERDAKELYELLITNMGFTKDKSLLLTDSPLANSNNSLHADRQQILDSLQDLCENRLKPGDTFWCFFSGYGTNHEGEDYILPTEGNLKEVAKTGISIRSILDCLKKATTDKILVLLDINRSQVSGISDRIGNQSLELARQLEIPTILSCRPNQVARETSALHHGFFTSALLEGLRSHKFKTLSELDRFLGMRLPELCDEHYRPKQNPLMVVHPPEKIHQVILPTLDIEEKSPAYIGLADSKLMDKSQVEAGSPHQNGVNKLLVNSHKDHLVSSPLSNGHLSNGFSVASNYEKIEEGKNQMSQEIESDQSFVQKLMLWTGATALLLLLGVFLTNKDVFMGGPQLPQSSMSSPLIDKSGNTPVAVSSPTSSNTSFSPNTIVNTDRNTTNNLPNQKIWEESLLSLKDVSASGLNRAIAKAGSIPKNDPFYETAQTSIARWSGTILDIAQARALNGNYTEAIAAAELVPESTNNIYEQAQQLIAEWQPYLSNSLTILKGAKTMFQPGQASSYSKAIDQLRKIAPGQPGYEEAQKLIKDWSETILQIATLRATRNKFDEAILAAQLVPTDTPSYDQAKRAIANWEKQNKKSN
ncbi:MAG: caspase family protein [Microcoleaceae cyanobacterium]